MRQVNSSTGRIQLFLALALLLILVAFTLLQGEPRVPRPFDPSSPDATGLRALWLWLEGMEYVVERNDGATFAMPPDSALIFVFPNQHLYSAEEANQLQSWVDAGGTLVLIGPAPSDAALIDAFQVAPGPAVEGMFVAVDQQQPLLPDLATPIQLGSATATLDMSDALAALPVLATSDGQVSLAIQYVGQGVVWHLSLSHSLINEQLRDPAQATLVPALLRHTPAGGRIVIDTYHLFGPDTTPSNTITSLQDWLYRTPMGWAVLFGLAVTLLFLLLQGRRLGPPIPTQEEMRRREGAEYVTAMANLLRRGQQRAFVAEHHKQRLKRTLGRALNVRPDPDDATFLRQLQQTERALSPEESQQLATLLRTLSEKVNEQNLTQAVSQVDTLLARHSRKSNVK